MGRSRDPPVSRSPRTETPWTENPPDITFANFVCGGKNVLLDNNYQSGRSARWLWLFHFLTSIVMLWEKQSRRTRICAQNSKTSTLLAQKKTKVPFSDQCEHFYMVRYFAFGPRPVPMQCECTITLKNYSTSFGALWAGIFRAGP